MAQDVLSAPAASPSGADTPATAVRPRRLDGVQLHGRYQGAGFRDDRYLAERPDGEAVLLTRLLYVVAEHLDGSGAEQVAQRVSDAYGQQLTGEALTYLVENKLAPVGIATLTAEVTGPPRAERAVLSVTLRRTLVPPRGVRVLGDAFAPLFRPAVMAVLLAAVVLLDWWLLVVHGVGTSFQIALTQPAGMLATIGLMLGSTLFHEFGHAAGCRYSGARPGAIGVGMYLWIPVFYTNVTDAYRLDRTGRLRTDLGGVYFNALFIGIGSAAYAATGWAPLAVVVVLTHLELLQQLVPIVRFDGYYILGDLAGVPNLFAHQNAVLRRWLGRRGGTDPSADLRPATRRIITVWTAVTFPLLTVGLTVFLVHLPGYLRMTVGQVVAYWGAGTVAVAAGSVTAAVLAYVSIVLLTLPFLGMAALLARAASRAARRRIHPPSTPPRRHARYGTGVARSSAPEDLMTSPFPLHSRAPVAGPATDDDLVPATTVTAQEAQPLSAEAFTEEMMLRRRTKAPQRGWRRGVHIVTAGRVDPGPSRAELRELAVLHRVKTPVRGARRIVVVSRKGGAGKTTTTLMLGHTFAVHRGDRVVALDANPDAGTLPYRVPRETAATVTTLLADEPLISRYADIRAYTSQTPTRLEVIASDDDPRISQSLRESDYHRAVELLDHHYTLILLDTGTGILDGAVQGLLREADQIVVVMPPALDGARAAASTLDWLDSHGHGRLVKGAVAVINAVRGQNGLLQLDEVQRHFATRCADAVRIPWDPALEAGAQTGLEDLRPATRQAYLELAAAVADGFARQGRLS